MGGEDVLHFWDSSSGTFLIRGQNTVLSVNMNSYWVHTQGYTYLTGKMGAKICVQANP